MFGVAHMLLRCVKCHAWCREHDILPQCLLLIKNDNETPRHRCSKMNYIRAKCNETVREKSETGQIVLSCMPMKPPGVELTRGNHPSPSFVLYVIVCVFLFNHFHRNLLKIKKKKINDINTLIRILGVFT